MNMKMNKCELSIGEMHEQTHIIYFRVYYADTDFSGVVYHARYLEFLERARSELLRFNNIHHHLLANNIDGENLAFAVKEMHLDFLSSAKIDDILKVETIITKIVGAAIFIDQKIFINGCAILTASLKVVLINDAGRPRRVPKEWIHKLILLG